MAFGIAPQHTEEIILDNANPNQILVAGLKAADELKWKIGDTSDSEFRAYTSFSMNSYGEVVTVTAQDNKVIIKSECTGGQLTDWGKNENNIHDFVRTFRKNLQIIAPEEVATLLDEFKNRKNDALQQISEPPRGSHDKVKSFISIFIPVEGYFITPIIINLNIIVFIMMVIAGVNIMSPDSESLINWGANFRPSTMDGEWWRLFTACFLHIGIFHLAMNMYGLMYIGMLLEPLLGRSRFLSAYLLAGLGGSALSLFWHSNIISAGASGAIFGMDGVFLAMLTTNLIEKSARQTFLTTTLIFVGYNLVNGLRGGIDNAAHIGGLISGLIIGYAFYPGLIKPDKLNLKYGAIALISILITFASYVLYSQTSNDFGIWQQKIEKFVALETEAISIYKLDEKASKEEKLKAIEERGIRNWEQCINLIREADALDIPEELHNRTSKILIYCQLRLESVKLYHKAMEENTNQYDVELGNYFTRIDSIVNELNKK